MMNINNDFGPEIPKGTYCLATKYSDGDPGDSWCVGYYIGKIANNGRHLVGGEDGISYRANGYRKVRGPLNADVGRWLMDNNKMLERSPPGTINLWGMLTALCFDDHDKESPPPLAE